MLMQDGVGGLQVRDATGLDRRAARSRALVCNVGDMLERIDAWPVPFDATPGPQRPARDRLSFPFFFDPGWDAEVRPVPDIAAAGPTGRLRRAAGTVPTCTR